MRRIRSRLVLLTSASLLLWACERHPLEQPPLSPPDDGMSWGMTPRGPQAGPLSSRAPTVLSADGAAPTILSRARASPTPLADQAPTRPLAAPQPTAPDFAGPTPGILWQNEASGQVSIWSMNGPRYEGNFVALPTVHPDWEIAGSADFNGDHTPDIL